MTVIFVVVPTIHNTIGREIIGRGSSSIVALVSLFLFFGRVEIFFVLSP